MDTHEVIMDTHEVIMDTHEVIMDTHGIGPKGIKKKRYLEYVKPLRNPRKTEPGFVAGE